jgi:hypothetical protein
MFNIGVTLLNRISAILALKTLPDEAALRAYMKNAFKGIFFTILGSIMLGATLSVALYILYDCLVYNGLGKMVAQVIVLTIGLISTIICFAFACKFLSNKCYIKPQPANIIDEKLEYFKNIIGGSINGFIEGLLNRPKK